VVLIEKMTEIWYNLIRKLEYVEQLTKLEFEVTVWQKVRAITLPVVVFLGKIQKIY